MMTRGFWDTLQRPIFVLAPMADVTDAAFRRVIAKYGKPDVMWTEFVSCAGLCSRGRDALLPDLWFTKEERPIVAQFFGSRPEHFYECALLARELGFDGIDINMGCPDRNVERQGAGAALIKNPKLAGELVREAKRGAGDLPVSVKTRIGYNTNIAREWIGQLLEAEPAVITIHARTRKEMSDVPARWDVVGDIVEYVHGRMSDAERPLIFGNGDIANLEDARDKVRTYGVDGVMIGRGIFGNPWFFNRSVQRDQLSLEDRFAVMVEHTRLFEELLGTIKSFHIMKKHYKAYVSGFDGARELRAELMEAENTNEIVAILKKHYPKLKV